jgi:hypothetical protein
MVRRLPIESPHDKFFRFAFKHVALVSDLIQWTFPASPLIVSLSMHACSIHAIDQLMTQV